MLHQLLKDMKDYVCDYQLAMRASLKLLLSRLHRNFPFLLLAVSLIVGAVRVTAQSERTGTVAVNFERAIDLDEGTSRDMVFSFDDSRLAVIARSQVQIFNAATGAMTAKISLPDKSILANVYWTPNGERIITTSYAGKLNFSVNLALHVWNANDGSLLQEFTRDTLDSGTIDVSPNRSKFTTRNDKTIRVWNVENGALLHTLQHDAPAREEKTDSILEALLTDKRYTPPPTPYTEVSARWSPNSRLILTTSAITAPKIWDAASGQLLATLTDARRRPLREPQTVS